MLGNSKKLPQYDDSKQLVAQSEPKNGQEIVEKIARQVFTTTTLQNQEDRKEEPERGEEEENV